MPRSNSLRYGLAAVLCVLALPAAAQARLEGRYTASLAGIPLGKGAWLIDVGEEHFTAAASGVTTGLARIFAAGQGSGASSGTIVKDQLVPARYEANISTDKKFEEVRMNLDGGSVKNLTVDPPQPPAPERIPLTDAHRRGVLDPMTASIYRVPGNGDLLAPENCNRSLSVFDGRMRYDLSFGFKRIVHVKADKGYEGPALVCSVQFLPIAGYIPSRPAIKYLVKLRDMEVWLAPIRGTRVLVPYRFSLPTPLGTGMLEATQFVITRTAKASIKTQ